MSDHTPAPWTITGPAIENGAEDYAILAGNKIIAECFGRTGINTYVPSAANARLVAAAPDLLAACQKVLEWAYAPPGSDFDNFTSFAEDIVPLVDKAITSATGRVFE